MICKCRKHFPPSAVSRYFFGLLMFLCRWPGGNSCRPVLGWMGSHDWLKYLWYHFITFCFFCECQMAGLHVQTYFFSWRNSTKGLTVMSWSRTCKQASNLWAVSSFSLLPPCRHTVESRVWLIDQLLSPRGWCWWSRQAAGDHVGADAIATCI